MFDSYAEIFAERGASYHAAMAAYPRARDAEFAAVLEPLADRPEGLLCDLPAGGGYLAAHLPPGMRYVGVDPSDEFMDVRPAGIDLIKASITSVPLDDESIDCLVSLAALHHEPDLRSVFDEIHRLVRPGGTVVIADVGAGTAAAGFLNGFVNAHNPMGHIGTFLDDGTAGVLKNAGFEVADDQLLTTPWQFDGWKTPALSAGSCSGCQAFPPPRLVTC